MKRSLLLGAVSALAMIASAHAANLSAPAPAIAEAPAPIWNWAGFYAGVNGGWIWNQGGLSDRADEWLVLCPDGPNSCFVGHGEDRRQGELSGGFGGGQIGFNLQHDRLVYGLEADIQGSSLSTSRNAIPDDFDPHFSHAHADVNLDWFGSVRGRVGLLPVPNLLVYITGGVAFGGFSEHLRHDFGGGAWSPWSSGDNISTDQSDVHAGWDLGAGLEYAFSPAWSAKLEYQFFDLGSVHLREFKEGGCECWAVASESETKLSFNTVRVGINYHFVPEYVPLK